MQPNEYQDLARTTLVTDNEKDTVTMCGLGIVGEAGEICDILKKHLFHKKGRPLDADKIADEAGDLLWYISIMAYQINTPMSDLMPVLKFDSGSGTSLALIGLGMAELAGDIAFYARMYGLDGSVEYLPKQLNRLVLDIALLATHIDTTLEAIMQRNIDKLTARHKSNGAATGFNPHYTSDSVQAG